MLLMGLEFMGRPPFEDVVINPTILAPDGRRMSKSLGTGIDPLELVDGYGADATRYGLLKMSSTQDVRFSAGMIEEGGKFANKLWNAARFVLTQADTSVEPAPAGTALEDRWIRSRLAAELEGVVAQIDRYDFSAAVKDLYAFVWNDFCDWYVEAVKPRLRGETRADASANLLWVLERILAVTHPICPFVTEAIWEHMPGERGLLMLAPLPAPDAAHRDAAAERDMGRAIEIVTAVRADPTTAIEMPDGFAGAGIVAQLAPKRAVDEQGAAQRGRGRAREGGQVRRGGAGSRVAAGCARVTDAERYIDSLELFGMAFGLERMVDLLGRLGNPARSFDAIHVVGTK